jgi:hypothetical protein
MWHATYADAREAPLQPISDTLKHSNIATTGRLPLLEVSDSGSPTPVLSTAWLCDLPAASLDYAARLT